MDTNMDGRLTWCEISESALRHNTRALKSSLAPGCIFAPVVKGNAYGHGLSLASAALARAGADWLCVFDVDEALAVRQAGVEVPLLVLGRVLDERLDAALAAQCRLVVYDAEGVRAAAAAGARTGAPARLHLELETGNWRQGATADEARALAQLAHTLPGATLEGVSTHFSDVEDTTDHTYARWQLEQLDAFVASLSASGRADGVMVHCGNSAATILWPHAHRSLVRAGIAIYGMWPSKETYLSALEQRRPLVDLRPALSWRARVVQVKDAPAGAYVGYGRTFRATHATRIATLGVGYADGYDRRLSNQAYALVRGVRAPVRGRVCMNLTMIDVTDTPGVHVGEAVTLLGSDGGERVSPELLAGWSGTINYEITTRIAERVPRVLVPWENEEP